VETADGSGTAIAVCWVDVSIKQSPGTAMERSSR